MIHTFQRQDVETSSMLSLTGTYSSGAGAESAATDVAIVGSCGLLGSPISIFTVRYYIGELG
jgi:hypothetical protein